MKLFIYFMSGVLFHGIHSQNDEYKERLDAMERSVAEMKAKAESSEARLRAEIKYLHNQVEQDQQKMKLMEVSYRTELEKVHHRLEGCSKISKNYDKRSLEADMQTEVAFFAKLGQEKTHLGVEQTIVFDDVVTNIDGTNSPVSYNRHTGVFTAPVNGLYVFSTTILSSYHSTSHFRYYLNNAPLTIMYVHGNTSSGWDSASQTVVLSLSRGDAVSVKNTENDTGALGGGHSIFSGFLLREHEGTVIVG
ncbi:complement C1q tumor necrosis factor-related protein 3-like [Mercenaria mercenaria]|uniref:complement C1q tumor necrosis factor-related protein 3-like n=1 Tax=Mercenaria mercenaria TaxID=6596 RepID=UPI00234F4764|nr:complement C1q tumor necrosis factor-related protein 3-like [Mercenaria mercenaria]